MRPEDRYDGLFQCYASKVALDWSLLKAQVKQESRFNPDAVSPVGAMGLAQFMPPTWKEWAVDRLKIKNPNPFNPEHSITCQAAYMKNLLAQFTYDLAKALAAYNWGQGNVRKAVAAHAENWLANAPKETQDYVILVTRYHSEYKGNNPNG